MMKVVFVALFVIINVDASSKTKPHSHQGVIGAYDGKPLPIKITSDQSKKLDNGYPVTIYFLLIIIINIST
jgi:hypothetical protein